MTMSLLTTCATSLPFFQYLVCSKSLCPFFCVYNASCLLFADFSHERRARKHTMLLSHHNSATYDPFCAEFAPPSPIALWTIEPTICNPMCTWADTVQHPRIALTVSLFICLSIFVLTSNGRLRISIVRLVFQRVAPAMSLRTRFLGVIRKCWEDHHNHHWQSFEFLSWPSQLHSNSRNMPKVQNLLDSKNSDRKYSSFTSH